MLRSSASRLLSAFHGAVRTNIQRSLSVSACRPTYAEPSDKGVTRNESIQGKEVAHPDYPDVLGVKYPAEAWSDGRARTVWNKIPPGLIPNPTVMVAPAKETDDEFDNRYINYFSRPDLDGWELRKYLTELHMADMVVEPKVTIAAFQAMNRLNELPMAIRWLECLRWKCGNRKKLIWPWLMQELGPTMSELGIPTLEELGYDKPELWWPDVYDM